jgi:hypothetical protein
MEQADIAQPEITVIREERAYERYGWMILSASAVLGIFAALMTTLPPISWFWNPVFESAYSIMGAWGVTWVGFNIFALVMTLIPYRRYERWAWYTLLMLPLLWLSLRLFARPPLPDACFPNQSRISPALPKVLLSCGERRTGLRSDQNRRPSHPGEVGERCFPTEHSPG